MDKISHKNYSLKLAIFFLLCFSFIINKNLIKKSLKGNNNDLLPQPVRDPKMQYLPCCCKSKYGYYGWYHQVPKELKQSCNTYFTCIEESFIGDCPDVKIY